MTLEYDSLTTPLTDRFQVRADLRQLSKIGLERRIEGRIGAIGILILAHGGRFGSSAAGHMDGARTGAIHVSPNAHSDPCQQCRAKGRPFGCVDSHHLHPQYAGQDLSPEGAGCTTAGEAYLRSLAQ